MKFILNNNEITVYNGDKTITKPISESSALFKALDISDKEAHLALDDASANGNSVLHFGINLKDFTKRFMFSCKLDN